MKTHCDKIMHRCNRLHRHLHLTAPSLNKQLTLTDELIARLRPWEPYLDLGKKNCSRSGAGPSAMSREPQSPMRGNEVRFLISTGCKLKLHTRYILNPLLNRSATAVVCCDGSPPSVVIAIRHYYCHCFLYPHLVTSFCNSRLPVSISILPSLPRPTSHEVVAGIPASPNNAHNSYVIKTQPRPHT